MTDGIGSPPRGDGGRGDEPASETTAASRVEQARQKSTELLHRYARTWPVRVGLRSSKGLAYLEIFDRAMTLAAQAFTSVLPILILLATLRPGDSGTLGSHLADTLQLSDEARASLTQSLPANADARSAFGLIGILVVVISATSFSRALTRTYAKAWSVDRPTGVAGAWRWVAVVIGVALAAYTIYGTRRVLDTAQYAGLLESLASALLMGGLWLWVPWLLMAGTLSVRRLLPSAVLMGIAAPLINIGAGIYLPRAFNAAARQFGGLGIAFTYLSWLFVLGFILIVTIVVGRVLWSDEGWLGRWLRGGEEAEPAFTDDFVLWGQRRLRQDP